MSSTNPNIAVVGGTRFDSQKGARLLRAKGLEANPVNMSETPQEQLDLYSNPASVYQRFIEKGVNKGFSEFVFYCNSLSFSYPWADHPEHKIFELTVFYQKILEQLSEQGSVVVVAEEATRQNLMKFVKNRQLKTPSSFRIDARLELINELEASSDAGQKSLMTEMLDRYKKEGIKEVVLGCTHFDDPDLKSSAELKVYQPGLQLIETVLEHHGIT